MELTMKLNATPDEFFERIEKSILADIRLSTGKSIAPEKLNGHKYKKVTAGKHPLEMKVKIKAYRRPERYEVRFTSARGVNAMSYRVKPLPGDAMEVTYSETFDGAQPQRGIFAVLNDKLYDFRVKRHAKSLLKSIERDVKQVRKNGVTEVVLPEGLEDDA